MEFHTVLAIENTDGLARKTWQSDPLMEVIAKNYFDCLPKKKGGIDQGEFSAVVSGLVYTGKVDKSSRSCVILRVKDEFSRSQLSTLILTGRLTTIEQKYCVRFMKDHVTDRWRLPIPPLEFEPRPLAYNVLGRLKATELEWDAVVKRMIENMKGLTLAVLQCLDVKQKEPLTGET